MVCIHWQISLFTNDLQTWIFASPYLPLKCETVCACLKYLPSTYTYHEIYFLKVEFIAFSGEFFESFQLEILIRYFPTSLFPESLCYVPAPSSFSIPTFLLPLIIGKFGSVFSHCSSQLPFRNWTFILRISTYSRCLFVYLCINICIYPWLVSLINSR